MPAKRKISTATRALMSLSRSVAGIQSEITILAEELRPVAQLFEAFEKRLIEHEVLLEKIRLTNEIVEQTLMNCLQAIRQNEALRAWYPAQKGHKEQLVAGPHPQWIEERLSEHTAEGLRLGVLKLSAVANEEMGSDG